MSGGLSPPNSPASAPEDRCLAIGENHKIHLECGESSIVDVGGALKEGEEVQMCELEGGGEDFKNEDWYGMV